MSDFLIISDFNVQNLAAIMNKIGGGLHADVAAYGQVMQTLLDASDDVWKTHNAAVVWTSPGAISNSFKLAVEGHPVDVEKMLEDVRQFVDALRRLPTRVQHVFVPTWVPLQASEDRRGLLDMDRHYGIVAALMRMNLALVEAFESDKRVRIFNAAGWIAKLGETAYSAKLWYLAKTPFHVDLFQKAVADFAAAVRALTGKARKLLILDLDDTLWGGIVGEAGWQEVRLGGHDPAGEAFRDFQMALLSLRRRGVMLGIVSKNEESTALEAIRKHPEMVLKLNDFVGWRINWNDKAQNVHELVKDLNLGEDAAVFIDDHPVERARVREALPQVLVPEWPKHPIEFPSALRGLDCFDVGGVNGEDRGRTASYVSERQRTVEKAAAPSLREWLKTLDLRVRVEPLMPVNLERTAQLLNKTNQMNLRTRRMSASDLERWAGCPGNELITFRVSDKFGDYGLVGIGSVSVNSAARTASIQDFVLSCRAMGRGVEEAMLSTLATISAQSGANELTAECLDTTRNQPCRKFFEASAMVRAEGAPNLLFRLDLREPPALPETIKLTSADEPAGV